MEDIAVNKAVNANNKIVLSEMPSTVAEISDLRGKGYSADFECKVYTHTVDGSTLFVGAGAFNDLQNARACALRIFNNWWNAE